MIIGSQKHWKHLALMVPFFGSDILIDDYYEFYFNWNFWRILFARTCDTDWSTKILQIDRSFYDLINGLLNRKYFDVKPSGDYVFQICSNLKMGFKTPVTSHPNQILADSLHLFPMLGREFKFPSTKYSPLFFKSREKYAISWSQLSHLNA